MSIQEVFLRAKVQYGQATDCYVTPAENNLGKFFSSSESELHKYPEQKARQEKAVSLNMETIDVENKTGRIKDYTVTLEKCSCTDFQRRRKPCKHMYCLASELGIFELDKTETSKEKKSSSGIIMYAVKYPYSFYTVTPKDYVVIDFETANNYPDSVCQIGIVEVKNNVVKRIESHLINPGYKDFRNSGIHGITYDDVKKAPKFKELWAEIGSYFEDKVIAAYNLFFDWGCLWAVLEKNKIEKPNFMAFDVLANVKNVWHGEMANFKLGTVARSLGIKHDPHNAESDALVTAQIQIYITKNFSGWSVHEYVSTLQAFIKKISQKEIDESDILNYCNGILGEESPIDYEEYKKLFVIIEQMASATSSAKLYRLCGMFYEKFSRYKRALYLYKKSMEIDSGMRLKTRIQRLEKIITEK